MEKHIDCATSHGVNVFIYDWYWYDVANFIKGFNGDLEAAKDALKYFRLKTEQAGFPGLHIQVVLWSVDAKNYSGLDGEKCDVCAIYHYLGLDSASHYQWVSFQEPTDYAIMSEVAKREYDKIDGYGISYFPHVSIGWGNNPRFKKYRPDVAYNSTPDNFEKAMRAAKEYVDSHELPAPLITVNSWNEWTETSYLLPDELNGYGYLEAIKRVFLDE